MFGSNNNYVAPTIFSLPTLSGTSSISTISRYGASSGGTITSNGGATITVSGVCWSSTSNAPTIADTKTTDGQTAGTFTSTITGLTAGVTYHVRAYATNSVGTGYGPVQTFASTASPSTTPVLAATTPASSVGTTSAVVAGNVIDEGTTQLTARGFVYGTSSGASTFTVNSGAGSGSFSSTLTGLTAGTTYYARSFATNAQGTTYGTEVSFTPATVITTVTIGTQIWTDTNLDVTTYRNGDLITYATNAVEWNAATNAGIGAWSYYNWDPANGAIYGKLYNWYAVNDSRRLAPSGYHIPTKLEYNTLATNSGTTLKSSSSEWGVNSGTNTTGFTGLPGGNNNFSQSSRFEDKGTSGWFWTSDEDGASTTKAYFRLLHQTSGFVDIGSYSKKYGMSVRLVRD